MKCKQCGHVQDSGTFCSACGKPFKTDVPTEQKPHEYVEQQENKPNPPINQQPKKESSTNLQQIIAKGLDWKTLVLTVVPIVLLVLGVAWGIAWILESSTLIRDIAYSVLALGEGISSTEIATLIAHLSISLWDVLLVSHAATATGTLQMSGLADVVISWNVPVILAPIVMILLIAIIVRLTKKLRPDTSEKLIPIWLMSSFLYALIIAIILYFSAPTYNVQGIEFIVSISFLKAVIHAFVIGAIGIGLGLRVHTHVYQQKSGVGSWLHELKPFGVTLLIWLAIATVIQIGTWLFVNGGSVYSTPLVSPLSLWDVYKGDVIFYLLLPTYVAGDLLYALGATLHLTSPAITEALYLPQITLHTWLGVDVHGMTEANAYTDYIQSATRFTLGSFITLLIYFYAVSKVRIKKVSDSIKQLVLIGVATFFVATAASLTLEMSGTAHGLIGFSPITASIVVVVVTVCFAGVQHLARTWLQKKEAEEKGGEQHE